MGFIYVVQSKNIDHLIEDYEWFKANNINYTLNMYLSEPPHDKDSLYISPRKCAEKNCELFDYWVYDDNCHIHIYFFDDFIDYILFGEKYLCCYNSCLGKNIGIRADGSIYNCNRDSGIKYCYGNITDYNDIHECFESDDFRRSVDAAYRRREYCKENYSIFDFCSGGCNNCAETGRNYALPNEHMCMITRSVFNHISKKVKVLAQDSDQALVKKLRLNGMLSEKLIQYFKTNKNNSLINV